jgi:hypothetical protein
MSSSLVFNGVYRLEIQSVMLVFSTGFVNLKTFVPITSEHSASGGTALQVFLLLPHGTRVMLDAFRNKRQKFTLLIFGDMFTRII